MTVQSKLRRLTLGVVLAGAPALMVGCLGASDDREGSGLAAGTGGALPNSGQGVMTTTQANREDKGGDPNTPGTLNRGDADKSNTGGLGTGSHNIPGKPEPKTPAEPEPPR